ncbi:segregation and condensation protein A [Geobacter argillaceus]|uniref:Segregation and condensation protein A n=1 Tax=Geobacter argillaceus TaxID=345631 RepID=A0A562VLL1_9BACT|nr:segregation/condensation protein A [Geobacter argillaceus]TWJ18765.1 condensin subunit ScpA [Geobacter argillaceus]
MTGSDPFRSGLFAESPLNSYPIRVEAFEGPLDLLLHLIRKNEVDIYNIPMAEITRQYLAYLEVMNELNLDVAGEFLVMASTLIQIKSKLLLPIAPSEEGAEESGEDPRAELVRRLLEYQKYKEAAVSLAGRQLLDRDLFVRPELPSEAEDDEVSEAPLELDLFELMAAFRRILQKAPKESFHEVGSENISIADRISDLLAFLQGKELVAFEELFQGNLTREYVVATFLAVLELCKLKMIKVSQLERFGTIWVRPAVIMEPEQSEDDQGHDHTQP